MKAIVNRIIENDLIDLKGLSIEGDIPVREEFLNELIRLYLSNKNFPANANDSSSPDAGIDFSRIWKSLDQADLKIELKEKVALLKINAKKF